MDRMDGWMDEWIGWMDGWNQVFREMRQCIISMNIFMSFMYNIVNKLQNFSLFVVHKIKLQ
jgi:hypothetical protein